MRTEIRPECAAVCANTAATGNLQRDTARDGGNRGDLRANDCPRTTEPRCEMGASLNCIKESTVVPFQAPSGLDLSRAEAIYN